MSKRYIFDLESDGFLNAMTRIHCLVLMDMDTKQTLVFRHNDVENNIEAGVHLLNEAALLVGHNVIGFDIKAIHKLFPWFDPKARVIDTMVLARVTAPDIKVFDYKMFNQGKFDSSLIGSHSLKAWGIRLGISKGDYSDNMKARDLNPWASWNQEMEDYCIQDVEVTKALWNQAIKQHVDPRCIELEHDIHSLCTDMEEHGFPFNIAEAEKLASQLEAQIGPLTEKAVADFGLKQFGPKKRNLVRPLFYDPDGIQERKEKKKEFYKPNPEWGEDMSRSWWGEVTVPKVTYTRSYVTYVKDAPHCKAEWTYFNPTSRPQIVEMLTTKHNWVPNDFTDTGQPSVDDAVLRKLVPHIPICASLADLFFVKKIYGQLKGGNKSWTKSYKNESKSVHAHTDTGGTVTGRASHRNPNIGQVPSVVMGPVFMKDGSPNPALLLPDGSWHPCAYDHKGALREKEAPIPGFAGEYGWECRALFHVPDGWVQVGVDLSGIEFRCLAELVAEFDNGAMIEVITSGQDVHRYNMDMTGITDRGMIKRVLYACVPMDTQALTRRGWKNYHELIVGEDVLTYNADTGLKEWKPVLEKVYYEDAPLIELSTDHAFKVVSTPNHRWFTKKRCNPKVGGRYYVDEVCTTEELTSEHAIIVNAPMGPDDTSTTSGLQLLSKWDTDWTTEVLNMSHVQREAFLTGFLIADGYWRDSKDGKKPGKWGWSQNVNSLSEAALMASYLAFDKKLYVTERCDTPNPMITVKQGVNNNVTGQRLKKRALPNAPVWCIRTENSSWVMRQGNVVTITGNTLYGAADLKLGLTANPALSINEARDYGREVRALLMDGLPALKLAIDKVKALAKGGFLVGLDGRMLKVRSEHSALNTRLQSNAGLIAKKWLVTTKKNALAAGMRCGWKMKDDSLGDFVMLAFVHDEQQNAVAPELAAGFAKIAVDAAGETGKYFNFKCPIEAQSKIGHNWAECH